MKLPRKGTENREILDYIILGLARSQINDILEQKIEEIETLIENGHMIIEFENEIYNLKPRLN